MCRSLHIAGAGNQLGPGSIGLTAGLSVYRALRSASGAAIPTLQEGS